MPSSRAAIIGNMIYFLLIFTPIQQGVFSPNAFSYIKINVLYFLESKRKFLIVIF